MTRVATAADAASWLATQTCRCGARAFGQDPVLASNAGAPVLRFAGCARCMQPPHLDVRLPEPIERAAVGRHVLDPQLVAAIAPLVASGFPDYAGPAPEVIDIRNVALGADWHITEWLRGSLGYGQARCTRRDGLRALATFALAPARPLASALEALAHPTPGVAPIVDARLFDGYAVLFEAEPAGLPLATPMFPLALDTALVVLGKLLEIAHEAASRGDVLRGLRPELVYIDGELRIGVAPRAERFANMAPPSRDVSPTSPFETIYFAPEAMQTENLTSAHDVFSCCAMFVYLLTRRQPYPGPSTMAQIWAMMQGPPELPPTLDPRTAQLVRAGLDKEPAKRPSAREIASAIVTS